ncbi:putative RNA 2'-phosphotransferase [Longimycelium tulufanense]|uniref:Probable RNA 2'-phosphotransferase n=1 Tax=Longimycelium tulufanense TaxID=907463 RepID=A0A8J3FTA3_9PSEU|nr:RNA 2'-phosphotransferase [Longimycelium tulufanense]GGM37465.1 putative RNA 2'-phosphotransferase [Longimycelium tulufanense]
MNERELVRVSRRLSRHLRHAPGEIGLVLDRAGWVAVDDLLAALTAHGLPLSRTGLAEVVERNDKRRFTFNATRTHIRANQGHSVPVDLQLPEVIPPATLYHGTIARYLPAIERDGLRPMRRHAVHLSADVGTALRVGGRRGEPVVLEVDAGGMAAAGHRFSRSDNGVWLTAWVPPRYVRKRPGSPATSSTRSLRR